MRGETGETATLQSTYQPGTFSAANHVIW